MNIFAQMDKSYKMVEVGNRPLEVILSNPCQNNPSVFTRNRLFLCSDLRCYESLNIVKFIFSRQKVSFNPTTELGSSETQFKVPNQLFYLYIQFPHIMKQKLAMREKAADKEQKIQMYLLRQQLTIRQKVKIHNLEQVREGQWVMQASRCA